MTRAFPQVAGEKSLIKQPSYPKGVTAAPGPGSQALRNLGLIFFARLPSAVIQGNTGRAALNRGIAGGDRTMHSAFIWNGQ